MGDTNTATLQPGTILENKWIIIELLGTGAMGEVYRAHQTNLGRDVAVKIISANIMAELEEDPEEREIAFARFRREVKTMAQVRHPNIVTIYDYGEISKDGRQDAPKTAFIVMEYIPGNSLRFTLEEDGLDDEPERYAEWIRSYFLPLLDGVQVLHRNTIVHRDLKPENIFLDDNIPKIADFGLARSHRMEAVTCSLEMLGTLAYMSPEQCSDFKTADKATDIYALGKILFEAVHGTLTEKVVPFTSVAIDKPQGEFMAEMSRIIAKATAEAAEARYHDVQELKNDLLNALAKMKTNQGDIQQQLQTGKPTLKQPFFSQRIRLISTVLVIIFIGIAATWTIHRLNQRQPEGGLHSSVYTEHDGLLQGQERSVLTIEGQLEQTMIGRDGSRMILTGRVDESADTPLFYMDSEKITNFLFIEFLNSLQEEIVVEDGIVRHGDTIVIYIDSGSPEENEIIYQHNTFHLNDQRDGSKPVRRVTYHGAHLYAASYGKELLSGREWRIAYNYHSERNKKEVQDGQSSTRKVVTMMHSPTPSNEDPMVEKTVLDDMGGEMKEWVRITKQAEKNTSNGKGETYESGVIDTKRLEEIAPPLKRFPWEGFDDVGFRTKITITRK